jgi:hypothetical protein
MGSKTLPTGAFCLKTTLQQLGQDAIALIALYFDVSVLNGAACAANLFQYSSKVLQRRILKVEPCNERDRFASPSF